MSPGSAATLFVALCAASLQSSGENPAKTLVAKQGTDKKEPATSAQPSVTLGAANIDKISRMVRVYFADRDAEKRANAKKSLDKLVAEAVKSATALKISDPLLALEDWREILQRGLIVEKPTVNVTGRGELKEVSFPSPLDDSKADAKELLPAFDRRLKALVSVPSDFSKVDYPVIIGLHPAESESGKSLANMRKSKDICEAARAWAARTYSKELLSKAIVLVPILDYAKRAGDGISYSRPVWESNDGIAWCLIALGEIVRKNLNYDARRIYFDGEGAGAAAALDFCTLFPSLQTGAIVRGPIPEIPDLEARFENATGTPILFVGGEPKKVAGPEGESEKTVAFAKPLLEKFTSDAGFKLNWEESLEDAELLSWIANNPKIFAPRRVKIRASAQRYADSYWIRVTEEDMSLEKESIVLDASADREKNEITVVTNKKVKAFEIFLNDDVLDLSREVRILHRKMEDPGEPNERFRGIVKRVIEDTLESSYAGTPCNIGEAYVASRTIAIR